MGDCSSAQAAATRRIETVSSVRFMPHVHSTQRTSQVRNGYRALRSADNVAPVEILDIGMRRLHGPVRAPPRKRTKSGVARVVEDLDGLNAPADRDSMW